MEINNYRQWKLRDCGCYRELWCLGQITRENLSKIKWKLSVLSVTRSINVIPGTTCSINICLINKYLQWQQHVFSLWEERQNICLVMGSLTPQIRMNVKSDQDLVTLNGTTLLQSFRPMVSQLKKTAVSSFLWESKIKDWKTDPQRLTELKMLESSRPWILDRYLTDKRGRDKYCVQSQHRFFNSKKMLVDVGGRVSLLISLTIPFYCSSFSC